MTAPFLAEILLPTEEATSLFGQRIAPLLEPGDVLFLSGPIGAGKTHLARAIIQARLAAADLAEDVPSPTFTLVQTYSDGQVEIWHADLYRLEDPREIFELGLEDAFDQAIVLVEWPEKLGNLAPADALTIELIPEGSGRRARLSSRSEKWRRLAPIAESVR